MIGGLRSKKGVVSTEEMGRAGSRFGEKGGSGPWPLGVGAWSSEKSEQEIKNLRVGCIRMAFKVWVRSRREGRWRGKKEPESSGPFCCTAAHTEEEEAATATESSQ